MLLPPPAATSTSACGSTMSIGSLTVKHDPSPGLLSSVIVPPINSQKLETIARPNPVPPYLRVVVTSACVNGSNTRWH